MPNKQQQIAAILEEARTGIDASANAEQLEKHGKKAFRELAPLKVPDETFDELDSMLTDATARTATASEREAPRRRWFRGYYLAPTPILGTRVYVWLPNIARAYAADVTKVESVGQVEVALVRATSDLGTTKRHLGVTHVSHPQHETKQAVRWDYMPGIVPDETDWKPGRDEMDKRVRQAIANAEREARDKRRANAKPASTKEPSLAGG